MTRSKSKSKSTSKSTSNSARTNRNNPESQAAANQGRVKAQPKGSFKNWKNVKSDTDGAVERELDSGRYAFATPTGDNTYSVVVCASKEGPVLYTTQMHKDDLDTAFLDDTASGQGGGIS